MKSGKARSNGRVSTATMATTTAAAVKTAFLNVISEIVRLKKSTRLARMSGRPARIKAIATMAFNTPSKLSI
jgi:hypothetical protein